MSDITVVIEEPAPIVVQVGPTIVQSGGGGGAVDSVNGQTGAVVLEADDIADAGTKVIMTTTERSKLAGVATGATANATDAQLRDRSTHTGSQAQSTITGLTSALAAKADLVGGVVPTSQLPPLAINDVFTVASQAAMLALTAQRGDVAIRTDLSKAFILSTDSPGTLADWKELLTPADAVTSVAGKTGVVLLVKGDVGLGNVDNTSDANKPVSTAQQTAIDAAVAAARGRYVGINAQTGTSYTPVLADVGKLVTLTNAGAITVTMPSDATTAFAVGDSVDFVVRGVGMATFVAGSGASPIEATPSAVTRAQYSTVTAVKVAANTWLVVGDLA